MYNFIFKSYYESLNSYVISERLRQDNPHSKILYVKNLFYSFKNRLMSSAFSLTLSALSWWGNIFPLSEESLAQMASTRAFLEHNDPISRGIINNAAQPVARQRAIKNFRDNLLGREILNSFIDLSDSWAAVDACIANFSEARLEEMAALDLSEVELKGPFLIEAGRVALDVPQDQREEYLTDLINTFQRGGLIVNHVHHRLEQERQHRLEQERQHRLEQERQHRLEQERQQQQEVERNSSIAAAVPQETPNLASEAPRPQNNNVQIVTPAQFNGWKLKLDPYVSRTLRENQYNIDTLKVLVTSSSEITALLSQTQDALFAYLCKSEKYISSHAIDFNDLRFDINTWLNTQCDWKRAVSRSVMQQLFEGTLDSLDNVEFDSDNNLHIDRFKSSTEYVQTAIYDMLIIDIRKNVSDRLTVHVTQKIERLAQIEAQKREDAALHLTSDALRQQRVTIFTNNQREGQTIESDCDLFFTGLGDTLCGNFMNELRRSQVMAHFRRQIQARAGNTSCSFEHVTAELHDILKANTYIDIPATLTFKQEKLQPQYPSPLWGSEIFRGACQKFLQHEGDFYQRFVGKLQAEVGKQPGIKGLIGTHSSEPGGSVRPS